MANGPDLTPLATAVTQLVTTGAGVAQKIVENASNLTTEGITHVKEILGDPAQPNSGIVAQFMGQFTDDMEKLLDKIKELYTIVPATPTPVNVIDTMSEIANAIKNAEGILNDQNFVISKGTIEIDLNVALKAGGPGASAKIAFDITPKPRT